MVSKFWALILMFFLTCFAMAQDPAVKKSGDYHTQSDPNRNLYSISAFAHGHRHGYEEGFHAGDQDYHFRHDPNPFHSARLRGYSPEFGDKRTYKLGFESGFRAGYADSYAGREFHEAWDPAIEESSFFDNGETDKKSSAIFDSGMAAGYREGFAAKDVDASSAETALLKCQVKHDQPAFCNGFGIGYSLAQADKTSIARLQAAEPNKLARNSR